MRLFTAILFDEDVRERILAEQAEVARLASHGTFVDKESLHLTLVFLGEVAGERLDDVKRVVADSRVGRFLPTEFSLLHMGRFVQRGHKRGSGPRDKTSTWWIAPAKNEQLEQLQAELQHGFAEAGFEVPDRTYMPHVTLGRRVVLPGGDKQSKPVRGADGQPLERLRWPGQVDEPIVARAGAVSLMRTRFVDGKPCYEEVSRFEA